MIILTIFHITAKKILFIVKINTMTINSLLPSVKIPYKIAKGSVKERQIKADNMAMNLFSSLSEDIKDNYTIISFSDLYKKIYKILPENISIMLRSNHSKKYGAYTETLYDRKQKASAVAVALPEIKKTFRPSHIPLVIHEFQHVTGQLFHPKYISRAQAINAKKLFNKKYEKLYDRYYYCIEDCFSEKAKKETLELVKDRTMRFLKKLRFNDQIDYIQDIRYSLESEISAFDKEKQTAKMLKDKDLLVLKDCLKDVPVRSLYREKIELLKEIGFELIKQERIAHAKKLKLEKESNKSV